MTTRLKIETPNCPQSSTIISKPNLSKATHCLFCTLKFKNMVRIGCPINRSTNCISNGKQCNIKGLDSYDTIGVFCSYSCAKAYAQMNSSDPLFNRSDVLLAKMYAREYKTTDPVNILPSPSPLLLTKYGGSMSTEQYENEKGTVQYVLEGRYVPVSNVFTRIE